MGWTVCESLVVQRSAWGRKGLFSLGSLRWTRGTETSVYPATAAAEEAEITSLRVLVYHVGGFAIDVPSGNTRGLGN